MGIRQRLANRIYRMESSFLPKESASSKSAAPSFIPYLIRNKITNIEDLNHLNEVARRDPLGQYIVYKLSENALDDGFIFVDDDGNEIMMDVQKELVALDFKRVYTQTLAAERGIGWAYTFTGKNRYIPQTREGGRIASLYSLTPLECVVQEYDENGNPKTMKVTVNVGKGEKTTMEEKIILPAEDFIFWNTRPIGRGYKGRPVLEPVWDMMAYLRLMFHSMTWSDMKHGSGIFTVFTKGGLSDTLIAKMKVAYKDVNVKRSLVVDGADVDRMEFIGPPSGSTDFVGHIDACLQFVAAGTGVPKDCLIGQTAGNIAGSETNIKALFATLNQIQVSIEPYIRELVRRMGYANEKYNIEWNARYAHDEEQQSKIAMNNAQTLSIRSAWLTINEIRAEEGLSSVEDGDRLKSDFQIGVSGLQSPDERDQTRNETGEQL